MFALFSRTKFAFAYSLIISIVFLSGCGGGGGDDADGPDLAQASLTRAVKIMPLGDSITQAIDGRASYRYWLWKDLDSKGYNFDFVGGQRGAHSGSNFPNDFDLDHEGHWSWSSSNILSNASGYAAAHVPDIVLLHIGTNDMFRGGSIDQTLNNIALIIDAFRTVNPSVVTLLASVIPSDRSSDRIAAFSSAIAMNYQSLGTDSSPVVLVDQNQGFFVSSDTYDGIHPNASGEQKMARRWAAALEDIL